MMVAVVDVLRVLLGVGAGPRDVVMDCVGVPLFLRWVPLTVPEPVDVLEFVAVAVYVAPPVTVPEILGLRVWLMEGGELRERPTVPVILGEEEGVLLSAELLVCVTDTVEVFDLGADPVPVLVPPMLRVWVAVTEGDLLAVIVRVPLDEPVPVLDAVLVAVEVAVILMVPVRGGDRDVLTLAVELRLPRAERVRVPLAVPVLEEAMLLEGLGELVEVLE